MRRFFGVLGILLGACLLVFIGMGVFLMLAPGTKLFGVQYIKPSSTTSANVTKEYSDVVNGGISIETYGVPINIEYTTSGSFSFEFIQKFNGFTRSKIDQPTLSVGLDDDGNLFVRTSEFKRFIWGSNANGYVLNCKIPALYKKSLTISSTASNINLSANADTVGNISNLTIITKGSLKMTGDFVVEKLACRDIKQKINIPLSVQLTGDVNIQQNKKSTSIAANIGGKLTFASKGGSLTFNSCAQLEATTKGGSVKSITTETAVYGNAIISSGRGSVTLQHVGGDLQITTSRGKIVLGQNQESVKAGCDGKVNLKTTSGKVLIKGNYTATDKSVNITTTSGDIRVGESGRIELNKLTKDQVSIKELVINTKKGKVVVETAENVKITGKTGNVTVANFAKATIKTTSGDVKVGTRVIGAELDITTGTNGNVQAYYLTGKTTINTKGKVYTSFKSLMGKIEINGAKKSITVVLPNGFDMSSRIFWIDSTKHSADIQIGEFEKQAKHYHSVEEVPEGMSEKLIKISSTNGYIRVVDENHR